MKKRIWLSPPHMGGSELQFVQKAFDTNWVAPVGPNLDAFEASISEYCNVKHVVAVSTGTAAIHLALILLGIGKGDEVIASSFTFVGTINPVLYLGATPILVDSELKTWNMCPDLLEKTIKNRLSKGKKPKAIILVHLYGMPANLDRIMKIAGKYEIPIIEDAAEALGSRYRDRPTGSFGLISVLSFNGNKIITSSSGGAMLSNDEKFVEKARFLATQARDNAPHYQHSEIGYNYRMSNVLAGIGCGQMEVLNQRVIERRSNNKFYREELEKLPGVSILKEPDTDYFSNHWLSAILFEKSKNGIEPDYVRIALEKENIESRPLWKPLHKQPVFSKYPVYMNGVSASLFERGLCLPSGSNMTKYDLQRVIGVIEKCVEKVK